MLLAPVDPQTLGVNLALLIGAVLLAAFVLIAVIAVWTGAKIGFWHLRRDHAARKESSRKYRPNGGPCPPSAPGICGACGRPHDQVYHLPSGQRRCPACYAQQLKESS